jgi:hypothetical protein
MNTKSRFPIPLLLPLALAAQRPWQQIAVRAIREAAANFRTPPREYGAIHWALWGDELSQARIVREFDQLVASGIYVAPRHVGDRPPGGPLDRSYAPCSNDGLCAPVSPCCS